MPRTHRMMGTEAKAPVTAAAQGETKTLASVMNCRPKTKRSAGVGTAARQLFF